MNRVTEPLNTPSRQALLQTNFKDEEIEGTQGGGSPSRGPGQCRCAFSWAGTRKEETSLGGGEQSQAPRLLWRRRRGVPVCKMGYREQTGGPEAAAASFRGGFPELPGEPCRGGGRGGLHATTPCSVGLGTPPIVAFRRCYFVLPPPLRKSSLFLQCATSQSLLKSFMMTLNTRL